MNTLRKALQKINHACGDCGGSGIFHIHEYPDATNVKEKCVTCSGTGIDIPLEFGCEVKIDGWKHTFIGYSPNKAYCTVGSKEGKNNYHDGAMMTTEAIYHELIEENLGKPSTLQDLMRALGAKYNKTPMFVDNGYLMILTDDLKRTWTKLDLSKTVETQTQEVINQLIEILS